MRRALLAAAAALGALPAAAAADRSSLPSVRSGEPPGPALLYRPPPRTPELSNRAPFRAAPLLVSGTDAVRDGEYLYQDYLFDDQGADVSATSPDKPGPAGFSIVRGDALYPSAPRYAANAADLVELRVRPTRTHLVFRATLSTVLADDTTAIGIGIDRDRRGPAAVAWPDGAGLSSPGLDLFVTAWGTGGRVTPLPGGAATRLPAGAVTISRRTNQMTIRVPRRLADPGRATWRMVAGVGLWDRARGTFKALPAGTTPSADTPASGGPRSAPAIFNLAFRFGERAVTGTASFFEDRQSAALARGQTSALHADVPFGALARPGRRWLHAPGRRQARIYGSSADVPEGVQAEFPNFGGRLQPYLLDLPRRTRSRPGLTLALHSSGGTYTQYANFVPGWTEQLGRQRGDVLVAPLGRAPSYPVGGSRSAYTGLAELDVYEVWRDVARRFELDSRRTATTGYSLGGIGSYFLASFHPDLFARAFPVVGAPFGAQGLLENLRSVPLLAWNSSNDDTVPYVLSRPGYVRARELGLRYALWTFTEGHLGLAGLDEWGPARRFLGRARRAVDPPRVDYAVLPQYDFPRLGLVHDHAHWVSDVRVRAGGRAARGLVSARSLAFGRGDPRVVRPAPRNRPGPPAAHIQESTGWRGVPRIPRRNTLVVDLDNVGRATFDGRRARLTARRPLRVEIRSDGRARIRVALPLRRGTVLLGGGRVDARGATLEAARGRTVFRLLPPR